MKSAGKGGRGRGEPRGASPAQSLAGLVLVFHNLRNEKMLKELVQSHGGKVVTTVRASGGAKQLHLARSLFGKVPTPTHVITEHRELPAAHLAELRQLARLPVPVVDIHWVQACLDRGAADVAVDAFLVRQIEEEVGAEIEPAAKRARMGASGEDGQCSECGGDLTATEIACCWECMRDKPAETRLLWLRFKVEHRNAGLVAALRELAVFEGLDKDKKMSMDAFNWAAAALMSTPGDVTSVSQLDDWEPPFVGEGKIRSHYIPEWLQTGRIQRLEQHRHDSVKVARLHLSRLPYVTRAMAKAWAELGLTTFSAVWAAHEACTLHPPLDTDWLRLAVSHGDELSSPMSGEECRPLMEFVLDKLTAVCPSDMRDGLRWQRVGGASRGKPTSHDLDLLATHEVEGTDRGMVNNIMRLIVASDALERDAVTGKPCLQVMLSSPSESPGGGSAFAGASAAAIWQDEHQQWRCGTGDDKQDAFKAQMLIKLKGMPLRQVDVLVVPRSQFAFYVLGWTGSREIEKLLKRHAENTLNLKLGTRSLYARDDTFVVAADGTRIPMANKQRDYVEAGRWPREEIDIWPMLGIPYRPPCDRNA
jgi:DNA polymerase/3'-5' exonuclease PolX